MGYLVDFDALDYLGASINAQTTEWLETLNTIEQSASALSTASFFQGKGADNAKAYMGSIYPCIMTSLRAILSAHISNYLLYKQAYQSGVDSDLHAVLVEEEITDAKRDLTSRRQEANDIESNAQTALRGVSDLVQIALPDYNAADQRLGSLINRLSTLDQNINAVESSHSVSDFTLTAEAIQALNSFLREMLAHTRNYKGNFTLCTLSHDPNYAGLYGATVGVLGDLKEKETIITEAVSNEQDRVAALQKEYEEAVAAAAKEREEEGVWKAVTGALTIVGGAAIIAVTWGAATPIVVGGIVTGGAAILYGTSNYVEGVQDAAYGSMGDIYTPAWNPIRDTVFGGDQQLYDIWGMTNVLVGGFIVAPVGVAYSSAYAAGMGTQTFMQSAGVEIAKNLISAGGGYLVGEISKDIGTELFDENIGRYFGLVGGIAGSGFIHHGLSQLDQTVNISGRYITEADRARLNSWDPRYRPTDQEYLQYRRLFDNPKYVNQETGAYNWPDQPGGFLETPTKTTLPVGMTLDRYGPETGSFLSPEGTPFEQRSLFPGTQETGYNIYEVVKPIEVNAGTAAPWFEQPGGGVQYQTPMSIESLIDGGFLRRIYP